MDPVRQRLLAERNHVRARLTALTGNFADIVDASDAANNDDEHDPEGTTIAFERAQVSALAERAREHLDEIAAALSRLEEGTYGICERCGGTIPAARLEARPTARTCVSC